MSSPQDLANFENLVLGALSPENHVRQAAVAQFQQCKQNPNMFFATLTQLLAKSQREDVRQFCAVMLRQNLNPHLSEKLWPRCSAQTRSLVKSSLLELLEKEPSAPIRRKVADVIAMLGSLVFSDNSGALGQWPELLPLLEQVSNSPNPAHRESVYNIFERLAEFSMNALMPHLATVHAMLLAGTSDAKSPEVRIAAAGAWYSVLLSLPASERGRFADITPHVFGTLGEFCNSGDDERIQELLKVLVDTAQHMPTFYRPHLGPVVQAMLAVAQADAAESGTRRMGMSFLLNLLERGGGMVRKMAAFAQSVVPLAFKFLLVIDDEHDWDNGEDQDYMEMQDFSIGLEAIDRLAFGLGHQQFLPIATPLVTQFMSNSSWIHRHAALMAVSEMAEGTKKGLRAHMDAIVRMVVPHISEDPVPRCRWAALNAVAQLATDFSPSFQSEYYAVVMPSLIAAMDTEKNHPRVVHHAALSLVDFLAGIERADLLPYADAVMMANVKMLQPSNSHKVQEAALSAVAAVAAVTSEHFGKYYDAFMPGVMNILFNARDEELRELRGRSMECIGLMGKAVGAARFAADAHKVMQVLIATQQEGLAADDPQFGYLITACVRICETLGNDFTPYLQHIVPPLMHMAANEEGCFVEDQHTQDSRAAQPGYEVIPLEIRGIGAKQLVYNTCILEEKAQACKVLFQYATKLEAAFMPYVPTIAQILVPLLRFSYNEHVRIAAVAAMPALLNCVQAAVRAGQADASASAQLWQLMFGPFMKAIELESSLESLHGVLASFSECIDNLVFPVPGDQAQHIAMLVNKLMDESVQRRAERMTTMNHPDFDEEELATLEAENETEDELLGFVAYVVKSLAKNMRDSFFAVFKRANLEQIYWVFIRQDRCAGERTAALCVLCDMIELCKPAAAAYPSELFPHCMTYSQDADPDVRQSALYGIGVCAQYGGEAFKPAVQPSLNALMTVIQQPDARDEDNEPATDNAVSSLGKICHFHGDSFDVAPYMPVWLNYLPLRADTEEGCKVHDQLCYFIESQNTHVLGQQNANIPQIVRIFGEILDSELVTAETTERIVKIWQQIQSSVPPDALAQLWGQLSEKQKLNLQKYTPMAQGQ